MTLNQDRIDAIAARAVAPGKLLIGGDWVEGQDAPLDVISPIDGRHLTTIASAGAADVDRAVAAARAAYDAGVWSRAAPAVRKAVLHRLADLIDKNSLELGVLGVRDNGTDISMALKAEPGSAAATFRYYAEAIDKVMGEVAPTAGKCAGHGHA